jgi:hypothetical protein
MRAAGRASGEEPGAIQMWNALAGSEASCAAGYARTSGGDDGAHAAHSSRRTMVQRISDSALRTAT